VLAGERFDILDNVIFHQWPTNRVWTRDSGPIFVRKDGVRNAKGQRSQTVGQADFGGPIGIGTPSRVASLPLSRRRVSRSEVLPGMRFGDAMLRATACRALN